jgi:hypothetical protein
MSKTGVYIAKRKDNSIYYRSSITYKGKHISLGSYATEEFANRAYQQAERILKKEATIEDCIEHPDVLTFARCVTLINYRDNGIYIKNPIYLYRHYFIYYLDENTPLKFDIDDLFYYSNHKIQRRGGYLFVADYGMQVNILSRYGIKNYSVLGRDYRHANQDELDYTYDNIEVINPYYGVTSVQKKQKTIYKSRIHINGNYLIGYYESAAEAAVAYNKAVDIVTQKGYPKEFQTNYILTYDAKQYAAVYHRLKISDSIVQLPNYKENKEKGETV